MNFSEIKKILIRLFNQYVKRHINKLILSLVLSLLVAGSTGAIAWLLDPAIKKIFIERDQSLILTIPLLIVKKSFKLCIDFSIDAQEVRKEIAKTIKTRLILSFITLPFFYVIL